MFQRKGKVIYVAMSSFFLPAKPSVKDRGRKGKIQRGRKVSLLYLQWVLVTRYTPSLVQEFNIRFFPIQKDKVKLKEGKKSQKKRSVLDEEIASDSDVEE